MEPVIQIRNLSKLYLLGEGTHSYGNFREVLEGAFRKSLGLIRRSASNRNDKQRDREFWALRNLDLDVMKGDTVGILGSNGAGKSTLLKVISRITDPTEGHIRVRGRMASLLEVGTGFHPELTGRENIYLNGAILGMQKAEIEAKFEEIIISAALERFLN